MKNKLIILVSILLVFVMIFAGCASKKVAYDNVIKAEAPREAYGDGDFGAMEPEMMKEETKEDTSADESTKLENPSKLAEKIIYNVHASLQCEDVDKAVLALTDKAKSLGGYVSYANTYTSNGKTYANIEIRIPAKELNVMETYSSEVGKVDEYTMSSQNITEDYYDIKARLEHNLAQEEQLLTLLKKAETIEDILKVRAELDKVQEKIESYKGRIRVWDSLVDYSTITYNLRPVPTLDTGHDDSPRIIKLDETWRAMKRGFNNSAITVVNFFSFLLRAIAVLAIPLIIIGVAILVVIAIVKKNKKSKTPKNDIEED